MAIKRVQKRVETDEGVEEETKTVKTRKKSEEAEAFDKEFPFGVGDLSESIGDDVDPRAVRRFLRVNEIEKAGKRYGWKTQEEVDEIASSFHDRPVRERKPKEEVETEEEVKEEVKEEAKPKAKIRKKAAA